MPGEELLQVLPQLAALVRKQGRLSANDLTLLLIGHGLDDQQMRREAERWAEILAIVREDSKPATIELAKSAFTMRGVPADQANGAITAVIEGACPHCGALGEKYNPGKFWCERCDVTFQAGTTSDEEPDEEDDDEDYDDDEDDDDEDDEDDDDEDDEDDEDEDEDEDDYLGLYCPSCVEKGEACLVWFCANTNKWQAKCSACGFEFEPDEFDVDEGTIDTSHIKSPVDSGTELGKLSEPGQRVWLGEEEDDLIDEDFCLTLGWPIAGDECVALERQWDGELCWVRLENIHKIGGRWRFRP